MTLTDAHTALLDDDRRFDEFYRDRRRPMIKLAERLVDHGYIAEELVQEAFQRVWQRWGHLDNPAVYLRTIVVNSCHDELRRRRVRREALRVVEQADPETHYLTDVLSGIKPRRRTAIVLRYYGGHSVSEVAAAMDIPTGTAKSLIHRGLADMRCALN